MASVDLYESNKTINATTNGNHIDHGWQKVSYPKRQPKTKPNVDPQKLSLSLLNGTLTNGGANVFHSLEKQSEHCHRRTLEAKRAYIDADANMKAKHNRLNLDDDDGDDNNDMEGVKPDGKPTEEKKVKQKKPKKPKVKVAEVALKINPIDLSTYLAELNEEQPETQMQKFANFYGKTFQEVVAGQFSWMKMFRENIMDLD